MRTSRRLAIVAGVLFIVATVADIISRAVLVQPILGAPDYLAAIATDESQLLLGALFLLIGGLAAAGIAIALYPVVRTHGEGLALGSVAFRLIEGALYLGVVVCLLVLVEVSREAMTAGAPAASAYAAAGAVVLAARSALGEVAVMSFGIGALMYYAVFYRARMLPRWLSAWGVVAVILVMASGVAVILGIIEPMSSPQLLLAAPIGLQEMVMAVWLIARGLATPDATAAPATATKTGTGTSLAAQSA